MKLPVPSDAHALSARLAAEERDLVEKLATLEARVRRFADVDANGPSRSTFSATFRLVESWVAV